MPSVARSAGRAPLPEPQLRVFCPVVLVNDVLGTWTALLRNINPAGAFVETLDSLPLGASVRLRFGHGPTTLVISGVVKRRCVLNYADPDGPNVLSGVTIRFVD